MARAQKRERRPPQPVPPEQKKPPVEMPPDQPGLPEDDPDPPPEGDPPKPNEPTRLSETKATARNQRNRHALSRTAGRNNRHPRRGAGARFRHASEAFAQTTTRFAGSTMAFVLAVAVVLAWVISGPLFGFSNTWQLVINTVTTVTTFLMVFLIQRTQNKEALAIQLKLNELVASQNGASNRLVNIEDLTEEELQTLHEHYRTLAAMAQRELSLTRSHSIEEAESRHRIKHPRPVAKH